MEPEEIDKLFKDRLAGLPALPSADAWSRLQQKIEPPKKEKKVWLYYVAASISILLVMGILFIRNQTPINHQPVAINKSIIKQRIKKPLVIVPEQATQNQVAASGKVKTLEIKPEVEPLKVDKVSKVKIGNQLAQNNEQKKATKTTANQIKVEQPVKEIPELVAQKTNLPSSDKQITLALNESANIIEVTIKRDNLDEITEAQEESGLRDNLAKKGQLLKNIYKQARNLKNGKQVELATLGINTERLKEEKNNFKDKINKVISL